MSMIVVNTCWRAANIPASDAASRPFALSSTQTSARSIWGTLSLSSASSFSSRFASSSRSGTRASTQRSVGGMTMVVTTAMATIMV